MLLDAFSYPFMQHALIAILLIAPLFGMIGTMIVTKRMAFFSDAIGHSTLTGLAIGTLLGVSNLHVSTVAFAILFACLITLIKHKSKSSSDTTISVFASIAIALGIAILSTGGGFKRYTPFLIGDILSITPSDLWALGLVFLLVLAVWVTQFNKLFLASIHPSLAKAQGARLLLTDLIFTMLIATVVTLSIQWVGILLINSLLVLPAASAKNIAANMRQYHVISVSIAVSSGLIGLLASYTLDVSTGPTIVLVMSIFFIFTTIAKIVIHRHS